MNIDAISSSQVPLKSSLPAEQIEKTRKQKEDTPEELTSPSSTKSIQPEELINQIKALTEDGMHSVRFERNAMNELVVTIINPKTDEVIWQIPPEELMDLTKHLNELQGNMVDTVS